MMDDEDDLAVVLSDVARSLEGREGIEETLHGIVAAAVGTVPGAQYAGITAVEGRTVIRTHGASADLVLKVDQAQYDTGQGPCLAALFDERTVRVPDLTTETRWPAFTERAAALGLRSMLSFQLYVADDNLGALNLYADLPQAFDDGSEYIGQLFATHAAVAMSGARKLDQLLQAMATRDLIGQAKGILMERHKITGDQAFVLLVGVSQRANVKLRDVAERLAHSGELVAAPRPAQGRPGRARAPERTTDE